MSQLYLSTNQKYKEIRQIDCRLLDYLDDWSLFHHLLPRQTVVPPFLPYLS